MRRAFLAMLAAMLTAAPAVADAPEIPEPQRRFEAMLRDLARKSPDMPNDVARSELRRERARRTHTEGMNAPTGWVANVVAVRADPNGAATVVLNLNGAGLVTNTAAIQGRKVGVAIGRDSPLYTTIAMLRPAQLVRFDGGWLCMGDGRTMTDCPADAQPSQRGALEQPIMLINFRRITIIE